MSIITFGRRSKHLSSILLLVALIQVIILTFMILAVIPALSLQSLSISGPMIAGLFFSGIYLAVVIVTALGVRQRRPWAWCTAALIALLQLPSIGCPLSFAIIWCLLPDEVADPIAATVRAEWQAMKTPADKSAMLATDAGVAGSGNSAPIGAASPEGQAIGRGPSGP